MNDHMLTSSTGTRAQAPSTNRYNHRLHTLGPHRSRHVHMPANPPHYGPRHADGLGVQAFNRRFMYTHPTTRNAAAPNGPYRPPNLTYRHPFNLDNTLAHIHQRTAPLRGRNRGTAHGRRNNAAGFSSQSSAGGVEVSSQGSGSSGSSRTVR